MNRAVASNLRHQIVSMIHKMNELQFNITVHVCILRELALGNGKSSHLKLVFFHPLVSSN